MVRIILHGCNGKMGRVITELAASDADVEIVAGVDPLGEAGQGYPVFESLCACDVQADVVIDFSNAQAVDSLLACCLQKKLPVVVCTTGLSAEQTERLKEAAEKIPVLRSANMSLGVNLLMKLVREAAAVLREAGFDCEIVERHHNQKVDAPSGTALALADSVNQACGGQMCYQYDRTKERRKRGRDEIGIQSVRGGSIVGEHEVIFAGMDEVVELNHRAYSRGIFGKGAVQAAKFLAGKPTGLYTMSDVIG